MALLGLKPRIGNVRILAGFNTREEDRYGSVVLGATTYSEVEGTDDEEYATTYMEFGGRSDHLTNLVASATGTELDKQLVSSAASDEQEYCGSVEMNQKRKEDQEASKDAKAAPAAA